MKKLLAVIAIAAIVTSCNNTSEGNDVAADSIRAAATADSLAAVKALADTAQPPVVDTTNTMKADTTIK
jgi:predicted small secreted protein